MQTEETCDKIFWDDVVSCLTLLYRFEILQKSMVDL